MHAAAARHRVHSAAAGASPVVATPATPPPAASAAVSPPTSPSKATDSNPTSRTRPNANTSIIDAYIASAGGMGGYQWSMLLWMAAVVWPSIACSALGLVFVMDSYKREFPHADVSLCATAMFGGWMMSSYLTRLADTRGRRPVVFACLLALSVSGAARVFTAEPFPAFVLLHVVLGAAVGGAGSVSYVLFMETCPQPFRSMATACKASLWAVAGGVLYTGVVREFPLWQHRCVLAAIPPLMAVCTYPVVWESPRYLVAKGHVAEGVAVLLSIAEYNGRADAAPETLLSDLQAPSTHGHPNPSAADGAAASAPAATVGALWRNRRLRSQALVLFLGWFACSLMYYGLGFMAGSLAGDIYTNAVLLNVIEVPASFLASTCTSKFSKPVALGVSIGGAGTCMLVLAAGVAGPAQTALALVGKFSISAAWVPSYLLASERFPVAIRGTGMGLCNTFSRLAGMVSPVLVHRMPLSACALLFGAVGATAGLCALRLPADAPSALVSATATMPIRKDHLKATTAPLEV